MRRLCYEIFLANSMLRPPVKPENSQELIKDENYLTFETWVKTILP